MKLLEFMTTKYVHSDFHIKDNLHVIGTCGECVQFKAIANPAAFEGVCKSNAHLTPHDCDADFGCIHFEPKDK